MRTSLVVESASSANIGRTRADDEADVSRCVSEGLDQTPLFRLFSGGLLQTF
jgi:hypothetical protein